MRGMCKSIRGRGRIMTYYRTTTRTSVSNAQSVLQKMVEDEKNLEFAGLLAQIRDDISRLTLTKEWVE